MKTKRALELRSNAAGEIASLFRRAIDGCYTSTAINSYTGEIINTLHSKLVPRHVIEYLKGYEQSWRDILYREHLVFGCWIDGKFYSAHSKRSDYYGKQGMSPLIYSDKSNNGTIGHYWINDVSKHFFRDADFKSKV